MQRRNRSAMRIVAAAAGIHGCRMSVLLFVLTLAGCTITTQVEPLPRDTVSAVCIRENPATWSKEFLPELRKQFQERGVSTSVYQHELPAECRYRVEYDANWGWDVATYLKYADIRIIDGDAVIGRATYDAREGSANMEKFGRTSGKLSLLMTQLLGTSPSP